MKCSYYNYKIVTVRFFQMPIVKYFTYFHDLLKSSRSLDRFPYFIDSTTQTWLAQYKIVYTSDRLCILDILSYYYRVWCICLLDKYIWSGWLTPNFLFFYFTKVLSGKTYSILSEGISYYRINYNEIFTKFVFIDNNIMSMCIFCTMLGSRYLSNQFFCED